MENASKALIMAATMLLGVMILSIGVYLFSVYGEYSADAYAQMEAAKIEQFNTQFLKYYGNTTRSYKNENGKEIIETGPILCTVHDIITLANLAQQNNIDQEVVNLPYDEIGKKGEGKNSYIQIDVGTRKHIERLDDKDKINFIQVNSLNGTEGTETKYYECTEALVSEVSKRVYYMKFEEI